MWKRGQRAGLQDRSVASAGLLSHLAVAMVLCAGVAVGAAGCTLKSDSLGKLNALNPFAHKPVAPASAQNGAPAPSGAPAPAAETSAPGVAAPQAPPAPEVQGQLVDSVVASVDGSPITEQDVKDFKGKGGGGAAALAEIGTPGAPTADDPGAVLKALITQQLLEAESRKYADKIDESDIDRYIQNIEERNHMTDEQLRAQLQQRGMSYEAFHRQIAKQVEAMTMIDKEVRQKIVIPDSAIEAYYKQHSDEFKITQERYRLAQILVAVPPDAPPDTVAAAKEKAEGLHKKLMKGADFGDLARQYSDDDSKSKGGELGYFGPDELNDEIAKAIADVKPGGISDVVRTKYGFHIVKVEEHHLPGVVPLDEVKGAIRDKLMTDEAKAEFQKWIDTDLAKQHVVETNN